MINTSMMMRGGAAIVVFAAALLAQSCTMPQRTASADIYSGQDYAAALDAIMTTNQAGE